MGVKGLVFGLGLNSREAKVEISRLVDCVED